MQQRRNARRIFLSVFGAVFVLLSTASVNAQASAQADRYWLLQTEAGGALSRYFGAGWQDALADRNVDNPLVPNSEASSGFLFGVGFAFLIESGITAGAPPYAVPPTAEAGAAGGATAKAQPRRFFPDALRIATGVAWERLGGLYRYEEQEQSGSQAIARNYFTIPLQIAMRGPVFGLPLGYAAALGPALMVPQGGVLVRTSMGDDTSESVYEAEAFRSVIPGATLGLGLNYPLGPGRLGLTVRGSITMAELEPESNVWLWALAPRLSYAVTPSAGWEVISGIWR